MPRKKILVLGENPPISYLNALKRVGIDYDCRFFAKDFSAYRGLLLTGGGDVLPAYYGKNTDAENINIVRDETELNAIDYFIKNSLAVFGVCRGLQILNVFFGGTLKCVPNHLGKGEVYASHPVKSTFDKDFPFALVNSYHRQAIDKVGKGGKVLLLSFDGVIEAVSFTPYVFGVQFHPEKAEKRFADYFYGKFAEIINLPRRK